MFGIKRTLTDKLFSDIVREHGNWECVRCGRKHEKSENTCDNSHYWGRGMKSVRWDLENCDTLCKIPCHSGKDSSNPAKFGWEYQKQIKGHNGCTEDGQYTQFKKAQLGEKGFAELMVRAHTPTKVDEKALRMGFKLILKRLGDFKKAGILGAR